MTTINYTTDANGAAGYVRVEWPNLAGGDDGQPFDCSGLRLGSIQFIGDFNGGSVEFQVSNEVSPANFQQIVSANSPQFRSVEVDNLQRYSGFVRPDFQGTGGDVTVAAIFVTAR